MASLRALFGATKDHAISYYATWPSGLRRTVLVGYRTVRFYSQDQCSAYAAAIAYYAAFSVVPLVLVILGVLGLVLDRETVVDWVFQQLPLEETADVRGNVEAIVARSQDLSAAGLSGGLIGLLWSASGFFGGLRRGLDAAGHAAGRPPENRVFWKGKLIDFALIPSMGLLLMVLITVSAAVHYLATEASRELGIGTGVLARLAVYGIGLVLTFAVFTLLYRFVPSRPPRWQHAMAGAAGATILFELTRNFASIVLENQSFSRNSALYAGFGTALAFLLVVFIVASIVLLGVEFARALAVTRAEARAEIQPGGLERIAGPEHRPSLMQRLKSQRRM